MRILGLWVVNYYSGSTSERFVDPIRKLGHDIDVIPLESSNVESELVLKAKDYDLLLHLPYPNKIRLEIIKSLPITTLAWNGDDEWFWDKYKEFSEQINDSHNFCVTTHQPSLSKYSNGILGSWGYSSEWTNRKVKKDIDVYFCGAKTFERDCYLSDLKEAGIKVEVDGPGYSGKIPLKEMISKYRRAKIGLSFLWGEKDEKYYFQIKARTFEIPAVGTFQLSEYCDELNRFFDHEEVSAFSNSECLIEQVKYYLRHEEHRERMALKAHKRNKQYSYKKTFERIFNEINKRQNIPVLDS